MRSHLREDALAPRRTSADLAAELLSALDDGALAVHYQPIVDLRRREVVGAAALLRWHHPERGLLLPDTVLPLAEESGAIVPVALWVLETACRQGASWAEQGLRLEIAVKLSVRLLTDASLVGQVRRILGETGLDPSQLLLEITESSLTDGPDIGAVLDELSALGVRLGLDDFGNGHSSLRYLKRHPIAALRVDASFVSGLGRNRDDEAIVTSVAGLAAALGSRCIAEGVETPEQHARLLELRCQAQGHLFARPVPAGDFPAAVDRAEAVLAAAVQARAARLGAAAQELAPGVAERVLRMHRDGASQQTIAAALNQTGALHPKGVRWHGSSVARYLSEAGAGSRASAS